MPSDTTAERTTERTTDSAAVRPLRLSPSRLGDFTTCPQLFKFRAIDRLPEPPSLPAATGNAVHGALESLFSLRAAERTVPAALTLLERAWDDVLAPDGVRTALFDGDAAAEVAARTDSQRFVHTYFDAVEDPTRTEPVGRELRLVGEIGGVPVTGVLDRLDRGPDGDWVVSDYKTGRPPSAARANDKFFAMRVYAALLRANFGIVPSTLRLVYLANGDRLALDVTDRDLDATERRVAGLAEAIHRADATGDWRPRPSRLCDWCHFRPVCPAHTASAPTEPAVTP